ncbi:MAG TPA: prolyl oligopeptidase family serine peptidase [Clostridiaceae bacterium]|nr:prolyl oligopeptidase family serine peptidase [Clostridiaceae bacterium]
MTGSIGRKFKLECNGRLIPCELLEPETITGKPFLLINLTGTAHGAIYEDPFIQPAIPFVEAGHRVISFDIPCHGERIDERYGSEIAGLRKMYVASENVFEQMAEECSCVVDYIIKQGLAESGQIAICGCSRGGYMALRAFASDKRIAAASAISPVTDWRCLLEFERERNSVALARERLLNYVDGMAGRPIYMAIGNNDTRVSTESCKELYEAIRKCNRKSGLDDSVAELTITNDPGHTLSTEYRRKCGEFLLHWLEKVN